MQLALSPRSVDQASGPAAGQSARKNKLVMGGVVALGAAVIAVNPIAPNTAALDQLQHRAVDLVASVTDSPVTVYQEFLTDTFANLGQLGTTIAANPLPILSQVVANQTGYAAKLIAGVEAVPASLDRWYNNRVGESIGGKLYWEATQAALAAGDFNVAYENFNKFVLFGLQNAVTPITNAFLSHTPRGGTYQVGIPEQVALNFAHAVAVVFSSSTLLNGVFQAAFAPLSGTAWAASRVVEGFSGALAAGDVEGAVNSIVNAPAVLADAFINGFDYDDTTAPWAGLLSNCTGKTGRCAAGAVEQFLVTIPKKIAAAIANPVATTATATTATAAAETSGVAATALPSESSSASVQTFELKVTDDAGDAAATVSTPTAAASDDANATETVTKSAPGLKAVTTKLDAKKTAAASSDDSPVSASAPAGDSGPKHAKRSSGKSAKSAS
ncbi:hypothetical protein BH09ACT8_BH09ACT8_52160 [soil metagenome]